MLLTDDVFRMTSLVHPAWLLQLINFKVSIMILYCCHFCVPDLLVTFVMLEDWLLLCLELLGLYVVCRCSLFEQCYELQPTFQLLLKRPDCLALNLTEVSSYTERHVEDTGLVHLVSGVDDMNIIYQQLYQEKFGQYMSYSGQVARFN